MDDLESIVTDLATDLPDATPSTVARLRFQLEYGILMLACGREGEASSAFRRAFELLEELEA